MTETVDNLDQQPVDAKSDQQLGEAGLAALKAEREARAAAVKRAAEAEARLKEFEDRDKTEAERAADALAEARAELERVKVEKTRVEIAASAGVPAELLVGSTPDELAASAARLTAWRGEQKQEPVGDLYVPSEGSSPATLGSSTAADAFAEVVEKALNDL